ncbi:MAG TPA: SDR family oxidoreductase [Terriglobales bacterium]|nr:SDR family oxidoreductase [Terriglobales bacterium]
METGLRDRVAIVAAASQGLGHAVAYALAAEGVKLTICSRSEERIVAAAAQIHRQHRTDILAQAVDLTNAQAVTELVESTYERYGRIDICVANSGGPPSRGFLETTPEEWQRAYESNFLSVVHFARAVIPHMQKAHWGRFLAITSVSSKQPIPNLVYSNALRPSVSALLKSLSLEFGKDGILFNSVGPGYTATARLKEIASARSEATGIPETEIFESWAADTSLKRVGTPEEVADVIVWLASERASNVTGQTILVDGGSYRGVL